MKLVIFGSSVAKGSGAENDHGWAYRLTRALEPRGWTVVNQSVGGDTTEKLMARFERDLLSETPDMVIIGLSLGNEGLLGDSPSVYRQYVRNMRKLVQRCRRHQIIPIVSNCYPNGNYEREHYAYLRRFNETLNTWSVASLDFLGTTDDGQGRWPDGTWTDAGHPNSVGHDEMFHAIPPSLFDNLIDEFYPLPETGAGGVHCGGSASAGPQLSYAPAAPMHAFSLAFRVTLQDEPAPGAVVAAVDDCRILVGTGGAWELQVADGRTLSAEPPVHAGERYDIGLTHSYCNRTVSLFVNGAPIGTLATRLFPKQFHIGGAGAVTGPEGLYQRCLVYRSCLGSEAMAAVAAGSRLRSSLELYAPLTDAMVHEGMPMINHAQTDAELVMARGNADARP